MDFSATTDATLWEALQQGSQQAFAAIYDRYFQRLYEYGMRLHPDEDLVKDAIQELFIKLWTNKETLSTSVNPRPYLLVALRSTIYNRLRPRKNTVVISFDQEQHDFLANFSAESAYIKKEQLQAQHQQLLHALNQLNARQKEILYLRFFEELDYDSIAAIMNLSVKGAYKLSARALQNMRDILQVSSAVLITLLTNFRMEMMKS
ncbi:RNA polymerase sigma factor [Chitinophaga arvensicola]|uniref:RNA polymerase sigma factor, sigma-70 family n=1 Tax=Chitinophaga arvensicola TaxID=29529 RepID=A0A1I0NFC5_9BACT|nr:sigma-70 family RNA polymerase sigma factor [Chitinophaga arvensicola]SEV99466.1 RNA polymerase sigma factor, sigma-70 family [Chitinophaga arvensicola]